MRERSQSQHLTEREFSNYRPFTIMDGRKIGVSFEYHTIKQRLSRILGALVTILRVFFSWYECERLHPVAK